MFKKYNSIENHYQKKFISMFLKRFPELENETYVIQEKLDGANIQLLFAPHQKLQVGKRSGFLTENTSFFDIWNTLKLHEETITKVQNIVDETGDTFRFFGELIGPGIQKRVNYGDKKSIVFFDLEINGRMLSPEVFYDLMEHTKIPEVVPIFGFTSTLEDALNIDVEHDSIYSKITNNTMEGVVIKPYEDNFYTNHSRFVLKKKSKKFNEVMKVKTKIEKQESSEVAKLNELFSNYINENRILSIFSKEGPIQKPQEMGKYIKLISEDAKEDFLKDNILPDTLNEKEQKLIFNVGSLIANKLKSHL